MRLGPKSLVAALLLAASFVALPAVADEKEDARAAMRRGTTALERGDAETALVEFEAAKRLVPTANAPWFFSAAALTKLERWREAVTHLETYLEKDSTVSDATEVRTRIAKIRAEHLPARVKVVTNVDADLFVDGQPRGKPGLVEIEPGKHRIEARAASHIPASEEIDVRGDTERTVSLELRSLPPPAAKPDETVKVLPEAPLPAPASPWPTVGWVTAGVGAAGLLTSILLDHLSLGPKIDDYDRATDVRRASELRSDIDGLQTGVLVGYIVSGVVLAAGAALVIVAPRSAPRVGARRPDFATLRF